jgi:hypothetical protein
MSQDSMTVLRRRRDKIIGDILKGGESKDAFNALVKVSLEIEHRLKPRSMRKGGVRHSQPKHRTL